MIKDVVFDLDGTLITFNLNIKSCRSEVIKYLTQQDFPRSLFSLKETAFDMLVKVKQHIIAEGIDIQKFTKIKKWVFSIVESFELEAAKTTKMFPGIPETLKELRKMDLKIALCTINGKKATRHILKRFQINQLFDALITRDIVPEVKPNPVHLQTTLEALNVEHKEAVIIIGDSTKDMVCARKLGILAVGVTTGLSSKESLINSGAHYIVSSANEILPIIQRLNQKY
ncbi:HAD family hydrolase [Thermoproteota archaeon]